MLLSSIYLIHKYILSLPYTRDDFYNVISKNRVSKKNTESNDLGG